MVKCVGIKILPAALLLFMSVVSVADKLEDAQFDAAQKVLIPLMDTGKIDALYNNSMRVTEAVNRKPVSLENSVIRDVSFEPGSKPQEIVLTTSYVSGLRFVDSAGNPWPISSKTVGNDNWFDVNKPEGLEPGNILTLTALSPKAHSNLIITLEGMNQILNISLLTSDLTDEQPVNGGMAFRVPGLSPTASPLEVGPALPSAIDPKVMSVLNNVRPVGFTPVLTDNSSVTVLRSGNNLYIRSNKKLRWPAFIERSSSGDIVVYKTGLSPRLIFMDQEYGRINVKVEI